MTDITLDFLGKQLDRMFDELRAVRNEVGTLRDEITVLTGIAIRLDGAVEGLTVELRGLYRLSGRLDSRVRKLEDARP